MKYFTHYWVNDTWEHHQDNSQPGELLTNISGNMFLKRGVNIGDIVYVVTIKKGRLFLCGKLVVGVYVSTEETAEILGIKPEAVWKADEHIIAFEATPVNWSLKIPVEITEILEFFHGTSTTKLIFEWGDRLDRQTLRNVRQLTPESAAALDEFLPALKPTQLKSDKLGNDSYAVIAENDESMWDDKTGAIYHFPKRYLSILSEGTKVIYYKGSLKNKVYKDARQSDAPYYFGIAEIGKIYDDKTSTKGDKFALIENYQPFVGPVFIKLDNQYLEQIPASRANNYWRDGVRKIDAALYRKIVALAGNLPEAKKVESEIEVSQDEASYIFESFYEGDKTKKYVTVYERNPKLRKQALQIHGYDCRGCGFNFEKVYGSLGKEFIHVHHINPVSQFDAPQKVNAETDLIPLCPNCHSMVHRNKNKTLSVEDLKVLIKQNKEYF